MRSQFLVGHINRTPGWMKVHVTMALRSVFRQHMGKILLAHSGCSNCGEFLFPESTSVSESRSEPAPTERLRTVSPLWERTHNRRATSPNSATGKKTTKIASRTNLSEREFSRNGSAAPTRWCLSSVAYSRARYSRFGSGSFVLTNGSSDHAST